MKDLGWKALGRCFMACLAVTWITFPVRAEEAEAVGLSDELHTPIRLHADGAPIDIGSLSSIAHAGPCVADVDGDGDRDLLVGDFPGFFWLFDNTGDDKNPVYTSVGQLQAGNTPAKTPVY